MISKMPRIIKKIPGIRNKANEIWAEFKGYLISNKGRWYSPKHNKLMAENLNSSGYCRTTLWTDGKRKHILTHIKVVELFGDKNGNRIPEGTESLREIGLSIDHVNRNKMVNSVDNLEIVTHQENCLRRSKANKEEK